MTILAKVIANSVSADAPNWMGISRLSTLQLRYPKFIHGEFMTHRVLSRNASSSRAIPVERLIKDVIDDPVYPMHWGKNQPGMSADEECDEMLRYGMDNYLDRKEAWDSARNDAIEHARAYAKAGYHKQIVNRLLEPFCHINVVVTATDWSNFFALRCHPGAQPEMRMLAEAIFQALAESTPRELYLGDWHLPYIQAAVAGPLEADAPEIKVSVARCARVSYLTQEGKEPSVQEDLNLYDRLLASVPLHASPAEHQATPDEWIGGALNGFWNQPKLHGNLRGWIQYRKTLPNECQ